MDKLATIGIAVTFAVMALVGPASGIGTLDATDDTKMDPEEGYVAGVGLFNSSCGVGGVVVPVGGACIDISEGEKFKITIDDDVVPDPISGSWRIIDGNGVGDSNRFCGSDEMPDPAAMDGQLQVFVGPHPSNLGCPSVGTTGNVIFEAI